MSPAKRIVFSLIPGVFFFGAIEGACRIWEAVDPPVRPLPLPRMARALPPKEPGEFRVLVYGDSTAVGEPEPAFGFVRQMEFHLRELLPGRRTRIFNFAQSGQPSAYVVRMMDQSARGSDADAIVVLTAHNEFIWISEASDAELDALYAVQERLHASAAVRRARRLIYRHHTATRKVELAAETLNRLDRDSTRYSDRVARYERNVRTIVRLAQEAQVPLFLCTGPCNLKDWGPVAPAYSKYESDPEYLRMAIGVHQARKERDREKARALAQAMGARYPDDAVPVYTEAQLKFEEGEAREARVLFARAKDMDRHLTRVLSRFNDEVRRQCGQPGVRVVDLEALFDERSLDGIAGFYLVADNCHPTPAGSHLIAAALIEAFRAEDLIGFEGAVDERTSLAGFIAGTLSGEELRQAQVRYYLQAAKTCLDPPNHKAVPARGYLEEALKLDPGNWVALAHMAVSHLMEGSVEEGLATLDRAAEAKGSAIEIDDHENFPTLEPLLKGLGLLDR